MANELPDWVGVMYAATRCNCSPWELLDNPELVPRRVWLWWASLLNHAETLAKEMLNEASRTKADKRSI